jgi:hypothetical protein
MLQHLVETSPWLRYKGIIGFIGSGLCCLGGIIFVIVLTAASNFLGDFGGVPVWIFVLVYLPMGVILFFPAYFLFRSGQKIRTYRLTHSNEDMESGLKYSKSYWRFLGILTIIYLAALPVFIIIAAVAGVAAALNM